MTSPEKEAENYETLIRALYEKPLYRKPTLGKPPEFLIEERQTSIKTQGALRAVKDAVNASKPYVKTTIQEYFSQFADALEDFRVKGNSVNSEEAIVGSINDFLTYRSNFVEFIEFLAKYTDTAQHIQEIRNFFENASRYLHRPPNMNSWNDEWSSNYRFILYELFVYTAAILIKNDRLSSLNELLAQDYYVSRDGGGSEFKSFAWFHGYTRIIQDFRSDRLQRVSATTDLLKERAVIKSVSFEEFMQAEFILLVHSLMYPAGHQWFPFSLLYASHGQTLPFFARGESKRHFEKIKTVFGISSKDEFLAKYNNGNAFFSLGGVIRFSSNALFPISIPQLGGFEKLNTRN
jgi:hypothetical protein